MKKAIGVFCFAAILALTISNSFAQSPEITNGLNYLYSIQNPDGSWGVASSDTDALRATLSVMEAMRAMEETYTQNYVDAEAWLHSQSIDTTDYLADRIQALSIAGTDQDTLLSYLDSLITKAWGGYGEYGANHLDTTQALLALNRVNSLDIDTVNFALAYLIDNQNLDGGFGFYAGDDSNVYISALALNVFASYSRIFDLQDEINDAAAYLLIKQNFDNGFGTETDSSVYETALSFIALCESGQGSALSLQNAIEYLNVNQEASGSWGDDPFSTALALRALVGVKPNLAVFPSDITFSTAVPTAGDTITITANIHNNGTAQADNVFVQFHYGNPAEGGALIGETTVPSITAGGNFPVDVSWTVTSASTGKIYISADQPNQIDELNETDNIASRNLAAATLPDLIITTADMEIFPPAPEPYVPVAIFIKVRNLGETDASHVMVEVYDGDPSEGGVLLPGGGIIENIPGGGSADISAHIDSIDAIAGTKTLYVLVDTDNSVNESAEDNNTVVKPIRIGGSFADLVIAGNPVSWTPISPVDGAPVTISSVISNNGAAEAVDVLVRYYLGDPDDGGLQIGEDVVIPAIGPGSSANADIIWDSTGHMGGNYIFIKADPLGLIQEPDENNNAAFITIDVAASSGVNLMVSSGEITYSPDSPVSGDIIIVSALIRNNTSLTVENITVEFSDGDPRVAGTTIIGQEVIPSLNMIDSGATINIEWDTAGLSGAHDIYVNIDPFNEIAEADEKDNISSVSIMIGYAQGPDLTVASLDTAILQTDTQTLQVSGLIGVNIENAGTQSTDQPFEITAFEDRNSNEELDMGADNILGTATFNNNLASGASGMIDVPVSGNVLFRDNVIYVMINSGESVPETDMSNNTGHTGMHCENSPACEKFDVTEKFAWSENSRNFSVYNMPLIANLTDDNGDTVIDEEDIPDIIFYPSWGSTRPIQVISGDDGHEHFTVPYVSEHLLNSYTHLAAGDIDNDGNVEIIGLRDSYPKSLVAYEHDGSFKWLSDPLEVPGYRIQRWAVSISDLDGDGSPEIISGPNVLDGKGNLLWAVQVYDGIPVVADLDMDGTSEVIIGSGAYRSDGTVYWNSDVITDTEVGHAVANLDDDPYPEVIQVVGNTLGNVQVYSFGHNGDLKWGPVNINSPGWPSAPSIGDFNGDGKSDIGISGQERYTVLSADGDIIWESVVYDRTWGGLSAAVFDFDGDGAEEIVYNDMQYLRIYDGRNGKVLFSTPNSSGTVHEYPVVADVDNDGSAEIVIASSYGYTYDYNGIRVFENSCDNWPNTCKIWNEYNYRITNVNDDGTIPSNEQNNWEVYNSYRQNPVLDGHIYSKSDITVSYITVDQTLYPSSVRISARIGNGGASSHISGTNIAFYDGDPAQRGVLIGATYTSISLSPGSYEDVSIIWKSPPSGIHDIFVIADEVNAFDECRKDNNSASGSFDIGSGVKIPRADLDISSEDITLFPSDPIEGQPVLISAAVHNTGDIGAVNVTVSFFDGDPNNGGMLIGSVLLVSIDSGLSDIAGVTWNTMGQRGINFIHVTVDPQNVINESNENNNESLIQVTVTSPTKPDIAVTADDISFSNQSPDEGAPLTLAAAIHNFGVSTGNVKVNLRDGDPQAGGMLLDTYTIAPVIPFGGQARVVFTINTAGNAGSRSYFISVDPDNTIVEENEGNNIVSADLIINSAGIGLYAVTDRTQYIENEDILITVTVSELMSRVRDISADARIMDPEGSLAAVVPSQSVTLNPLETQTLNFTWNTGTTLAGDYTVRVPVHDSGLNSLAAQSVPISIVSTGGIATNLAVDRITYNPNETAGITSTVTNSCVNRIYENITAAITVKDMSGQTLFIESRPIGILTPSTHYSFNTYWNTSSNPPGNYPVTLEVKDVVDNVLSVNSASLTISSDINPSQHLSGEIFVDSQSLLQGDPVSISYSITNIGNIDLSQIDVSILTVHAVDLTVYDTLTDQTSLFMSETFSNVQQIGTLSYSAKDYLVVLRAAVFGTEETLASTYFRVEGSPSAPSLNWPIHGEDVETLIPGLIVNNASDPNDDELTYGFELYADSGLTTLLASESGISEGENNTTWTVPFELVENEMYVWRARVYDGILYGDWMPPAAFRVNVENDAPTTPTLSSPVNGSTVDTSLPLLTVNNASDPDSEELIYNFDVSTDENFTNIIASETGVASEDGMTSWQVPVDLTENATYYWRAQADDWLMEGPWMETASFFVDTANDAPSAPEIIEPQDGAEVQILDVDIKAHGAEDPEFDPLSYQFETDTMVTFNSQALMNSGYILEGTNGTIWNAGGLTDNTTYYVRANANDGLIDGPWSIVVSFFVNTINDAPGTPVLANPSYGGAANVFNPVLSVHNSTDIDGDDLTYEFELYDTESMGTLVAGAAGVAETEQTTAWTVPVTLVENESYYWRVRAYDGVLYSGWMPLAYFMLNTANDAPGAPTLHSPQNGSSVETLTPSLEFENAIDPDNDSLTYEIEIYIGDTLVNAQTGIPENSSGITSFTLETPLSDNKTYSWRARAYDGDRYGAWMDTVTFSIHIPADSISATIDFRPRTLNKASHGRWVVVFIELPEGYDVRDIDRSSILLEGSVQAMPWPYRIGDYDRDGRNDLMVKFRRSEVINVLPEGDEAPVTVTGTVGTTAFEGVDSIRVLPAPQWRHHPSHKRCKSKHYWKRHK